MTFKQNSLQILCGVDKFVPRYLGKSANETQIFFTFISAAEIWCNFTKFNFLVYNVTNYANYALLSPVRAVALYTVLWVGCVKYRRRPFRPLVEQKPLDRSKPNLAH